MIAPEKQGRDDGRNVLKKESLGFFFFFFFMFGFGEQKTM